MSKEVEEALEWADEHVKSYSGSYVEVLAAEVRTLRAEAELAGLKTLVGTVRTMLEDVGYGEGKIVDCLQDLTKRYEALVPELDQAKAESFCASKELAECQILVRKQDEQLDALRQEVIDRKDTADECRREKETLLHEFRECSTCDPASAECVRADRLAKELEAAKKRIEEDGKCFPCPQRYNRDPWVRESDYNKLKSDNAALTALLAKKDEALEKGLKRLEQYMMLVPSKGDIQIVQEMVAALAPASVEKENI